MKLSTELKKLPVVSIAEGEEVGIVKDFIIDPESKSIVAMVIEDKQWYEGAKVISFSLVHSIGDFAITTENSSSVVSLSSMPELTDLIQKKLKIIDARVITRGGRLIGYVSEYSVDDRTGEIIGLELKRDSNIASPDRNVIPTASVATIGRDIIIVDEDVDANLKTDHGEAAGVIPTPVRPTVPPPRPKPQPAAPAPKPAYVPEPPSAPAPKSAHKPAIEEVGGIDSASDVDIEELLDLDAEAEHSGLVEEPAPPAEEGKESLSEIFERRQIKYMLGKKVSKDIVTDDGTLIVGHGDVITDVVIQEAKASGKFLELSMNIEIEE
jgi:uncharacterized protein YrrD